MEYLYFLLQLILALILGWAIGWQRGQIGKAAGPRTYALVCIGSTLFTILSKQAFDGADTGKVAAQIITGIGFLGAGIILHKKDTVVGLTTAAGLWAISAVGMAIGTGWLIPAIMTSIIIFIVLSINDGDKPKKKANIDTKR